MARLPKPRKSSAATQSSIYTARKRPWRRQSSSCSFTKTSCRAGKEPASSAPSRLAALEAAPAAASASLLRIWRSRQISASCIATDGLTRRPHKSLRPILPCNHQDRTIEREQHGSDTKRTDREYHSIPRHRVGANRGTATIRLRCPKAHETTGVDLQPVGAGARTAPDPIEPRR